MWLLLVGLALLAGIAVGVALRRRTEPGRSAPPAPAVASLPVPGESADAGTEPPLPEHLEQRIRTERGFDDLAQFGLVGDLAPYLVRARMDGASTDQALIDVVMAAALADSILKLEEPDVPREIAGQRLAEVFTKCQEAASWDDLPLTRGYARRFLDREEGLAVRLVQERGRRN